MSLPVMEILPPFLGVVLGVRLGCGYVGDLGTGANVRRSVFHSCSWLWQWRRVRDVRRVQSIAF